MYLYTISMRRYVDMTGQNFIGGLSSYHVYFGDVQDK